MAGVATMQEIARALIKEAVDLEAAGKPIAAQAKMIEAQDIRRQIAEDQGECNTSAESCSMQHQEYADGKFCI